MGCQSFTRWLLEEMIASRYALLTLLEKKDRLLYQDAATLRQTYTERVGVHEETVLKAELEVTMTKRKIALIQAAINQRKPVEMESIQQQIDKEQAVLLAQMAVNDTTANAMPELDEKTLLELQTKYRAIVRDFHPAANNISDTQKELYEKALDAYKHQNFEAIQIIYDMLFEPAEPVMQVPIQQIPTKTSEQIRTEIRDIANVLASDYSLAKILYPHFSQTEEDIILIHAQQQYREEQLRLEQELETIQNSFPFNAVSMLQSPEKTNQYLEELAVRLRNSEEETSVLNRRIQTMLREAKHG